MPIPEASRRFHIIVDAYNCQERLLSDIKKVDKVIRDIAKLCGMTLLHGPVVMEGVPENPGVTGFAIIDFSHISIHTFTKERELCVDIFSCKPFSYHKVREYVKESFNLEDEYVRYVEVKYQPALKNKPSSDYPRLANS